MGVLQKLPSGGFTGKASVRLAVFFAAQLLLSPVHIALGQENTGSAAMHPVSVVNPLDGLVFAAGILKAGDPEGPMDDELTFKNGKFSSAICMRYNFSPAPYWTRQEDGKIRFRAELTSPTDGRMIWEGAINDGKLEGTMHWTKKRWYWTIDAKHNIHGELIKGSAQNSSQ